MVSGTVYIEVACTGEKRRHTEASLLKRMAAIQARGSKDQKIKDAAVKEAKKSLDLINKDTAVDVPRAYFRKFSSDLDGGVYIPEAMETGAWGKVEVPVV